MECVSWILLSSLMLIWISEVSSQDLCYVYGRGYKWCEHGCCSNDCCDGLEPWVAGLIAFGVIITVFIVIVVVCVVIKKQGQKGRVVHPRPKPQTTVTTFGVPPPGGYGPPPYNTGYPHPPPQMYSDPAYPPAYQPPPQPAVAPDPFAAAAASGQ